MRDIDDLTLALHDLLERRGALNLDEISTELELTKRRTAAVIRHHRLVLTDAQQALIMDHPAGQTYLYRLSQDPVEIRQWAGWMLRHLAPRMETSRGVIRIGVQLTDGRTIEGKRQRYIERALERLIEDVEEMLA